MHSHITHIEGILFKGKNFKLRAGCLIPPLTYLTFKNPIKEYSFTVPFKINNNPKISFNEIKLFQYKYML